MEERRFTHMTARLEIYAIPQDNIDVPPEDRIEPTKTIYEAQLTEENRGFQRVGRGDSPHQSILAAISELD
jgi:hypothetical protein